MSSFQEWSEQLSKNSPIVLPLHKVAVALDESYSSLYNLIFEGYDRVKLINTENNPPCPLCQYRATIVNNNGGVDLAKFLGFKKVYKVIRDEKTQQDIIDVDPQTGMPKFELQKEHDVYKNAPLYNWTHVGCRCALLVYKSSNPGITHVVTRDGSVS